ncbi:hypothetical protein D3C85_1661440 [compost metagenome]
MASMVVIAWLATLLTGMMQERRGRPSASTVQAPHWATPQPYLVPVSPSSSRITQSSGVSGATSTWRFVPLIISSMGLLLG